MKKLHIKFSDLQLGPYQQWVKLFGVIPLFKSSTCGCLLFQKDRIRRLDYYRMFGLDAAIAMEFHERKLDQYVFICLSAENTLANRLIAYDVLKTVVERKVGPGEVLFDEVPAVL